jgi:manganese/zinc/iron transport system substrate-binding protein
VKIGGQLYSDSMGKAGTRDGTWVGMIEHNVRTVVEALGGKMVEAPEAKHGQ